jgi:hypothetical protein
LAHNNEGMRVMGEDFGFEMGSIKKVVEAEK